MLSSKKSSSKAQDMYYLDDSVEQSLASIFSAIRDFGDAGDITNIEVIQPLSRSQANGMDDEDIRHCYNVSEAHPNHVLVLP